MQEDKLHTIQSAAEYLGSVSTYSVEKWLSRGRIRRTKVGRRTMIYQSELDRFIRDSNPPMGASK